MRIAIIGGGIGGLAAALQLLKTGFDVHVYERAAAIGEIGAGIQISPNASRLLVRLGLKPAMDKVGVRPLAAAAGVLRCRFFFTSSCGDARRTSQDQPAPSRATPAKQVREQRQGGLRWLPRRRASRRPRHTTDHRCLAQW